MLTDIQAQVESIVPPIVEKAGLQLVELSVAQSGLTYKIEVLCDRPQGGITLEECVKLNKVIVEIFDLQPWAEDYELVVASPGLDRPLKNQKDFARMLGQRVKVLLTEKVDGKGEYSGLVKEVFEDAVLIAIRKKEIKLPYDKILKAGLMI